MGTVSLSNVAILLDEIEQARKAVDGGFTYSEGYYDGLRMALDILEGLLD